MKGMIISMQKRVNGFNCNLKVEVSTENSMIYVCSNKPSFHKINVHSCSYIDEITYCGDLKNDDNVIHGDLGKYYIMEDGILFAPNKCSNKNLELLTFQFRDTCGNKVNITVPFFMIKFKRRKKCF